jgi:hypothetical protein
MGSLRSIAVAAVLTLASSAALAHPTAAQRAKASELVKKAIAKSQAGEHAEAIDLYLQAYTIIPQPLLLSNVGSEYQQQGKKVEALKYYCRYLAADPTGTNSTYATAQARTLQIELGNEVDESDVCKPASPPAPPPPPPPPAGNTTSAPAGVTGTAGLSGGATELPASRNRGLQLAGFATAGVGVAAIGVGVYFGFDGKRLSDYISNYTTDPDTAGKPWPSNIQDKQHRGELDNELQTAFLIGGGVAVAAGAVMIVLARSHHTDEHLAVIPEATPSSAGFAVAGRF